MELLIITLILIGLDIVSGTIAAGVNGTLSSKVARQGLMHKSAYLMCIFLANVLDHAQTFVDLGLDVNLQALACYYIIICETLSIIENIAKINPELRGTKLLQLFIGTHKEDNETQEKGNEK